MRPWLLVLVVVLFAAAPATAKAQVGALKSAATAAAKSGAKAMSKGAKSAAAMRRATAGRAAAASVVVADEGAVAAQASVRGSADDGVSAVAKAPKSLEERVADRAGDAIDVATNDDVQKYLKSGAAPAVDNTPGPIGIILVGLTAVGMLWARMRRKRPQ